mgnify:CR=1 FL=1
MWFYVLGWLGGLGLVGLFLKIVLVDPVLELLVLMWGCEEWTD